MANEIHKTYDYGIFKYRLGNRAVSDTRKKLLVENIKKYGWVTNPILVNSNMEILDGQGRFEALKELHLPVEFIIVENATDTDCVALNLRNTRWTPIEYINFFSVNGSEDYKRIKSLMDKFRVSPNIVLRAAKRGQFDGGGKRIRNLGGDLEFSEEDYTNAEQKLEKYTRLHDLFSTHRSNNNGIDSTIFFCIENGVDIEKLEKAEKTYGRTDFYFRDMEGSLQYIEDIYNHRKHDGNRIYLVELYKKTSWGIKSSRRRQNAK